MVEKLMDVYVAGLWDEGGRLAKIKSYALLLEAVRVTRKILLSYFFAFLAGMLLTAAVFSGLLHTQTNYEKSGQLFFDEFTWMMAGISILMVGIFGAFVRERRWLLAFKIEERIRELKRTPDAFEESPRPSGIDEGRLSEMIEKILDDKMREQKVTA